MLINQKHHSTLGLLTKEKKKEPQFNTGLQNLQQARSQKIHYQRATTKHNNSIH